MATLPLIPPQVFTPQHQTVQPTPQTQLVPPDLLAAAQAGTGLTEMLMPAVQPGQSQSASYQMNNVGPMINQDQYDQTTKANRQALQANQRLLDAWNAGAQDHGARTASIQQYNDWVRGASAAAGQRPNAGGGALVTPPQAAGFLGGLVPGAYVGQQHMLMTTPPAPQVDPRLMAPMQSVQPRTPYVQASASAAQAAPLAGGGAQPKPEQFALYKVLGERGQAQEIGEVRGFRDAISGMLAGKTEAADRGTVLRNNWRQLFQTGARPVKLYVPDAQGTPKQRTYANALEGMHALLAQQIYEYPDAPQSGGTYKRGPFTLDTATGDITVHPDLVKLMDDSIAQGAYDAAAKLEANNILAPMDEIFRFSNFFSGQNLERLVASTAEREPGGTRRRYDPVQRERAVQEALPYYLTQIMLRRTSAKQFDFDEQRARRAALDFVSSGAAKP